MNHKPRFIYFDMGNVLLHFDVPQACRQMAQLAGTSEQRVQQVVFDSDLQVRYERGELSSDEFHGEFCRLTGTRPARGALARAASDMFEVNADVVPLVASLKAAGHRLGILSNTCEVHWQFVSDGRYAFLPGHFESTVLSYEVGSMKPEPLIYSRAAEVAGVPPEEVFFTDDRQENVEAARHQGFDAVLFTDAERLAGQLRRRGLP